MQEMQWNTSVIESVHKLFLLGVDNSCLFWPSCAPAPHEASLFLCWRPITKEGMPPFLPQKAHQNGASEWSHELNLVFIANTVVITSKENKSALVHATEQGVCLHFADDVHTAAQGAWRVVYWKPPEITVLVLASFSSGAMHTCCLSF